jgi:imidazolonepropionase
VLGTSLIVALLALSTLALQRIQNRMLTTTADIRQAQLNAEAAIELGLRYGATSIDHLEHATADEASRLAQTGVMVTLLPCASLVRGGRQAPARAFIDGGAPVALGTNFNAHHTPSLNMQTMVALACLQMKMTVEEAISAATINAAHAVGCGEQAGSLELNKPADLVLLNVGDYRDLAHNVGTNLVHRTIKRGRVIYEEGRVASRAAEASSSA